MRWLGAARSGAPITRSGHLPPGVAASSSRNSRFSREGDTDCPNANAISASPNAPWRPWPSAGSHSQLKKCRSEEHTSELQSQSNLVCRLVLEKKKLYDILHQHFGGLLNVHSFFPT